MNIDEIEKEIRRLERLIEQVYVDFKPKFDALHEKFDPYVNTGRFSSEVRERARKAYLWAYVDLCGARMRAINAYSYPQIALKIQVREYERKVRMSAREQAA